MLHASFGGFTRSRGFKRTLVGASLLAIGGFSLTQLHASAGPPVTFAYDYVSTTLAGGEPFVIYSHAGKDLVYSSHEGTTHIDKNYATDPNTSCEILPPSIPPSGFICSYDNQVIIWYSTDGGKTWTKSPGNPLYTGFSDPSLTEDAGGFVYDTGIDLANDAVYASHDGGKNWVPGTTQCHDGDRPWLMGGKNGEVFMSTDTVEDGHEFFRGLLKPSAANPLTILCSQNGITDPSGGDAQGYYDHNTGALVEGSAYHDGGFGIGYLPHASTAWDASNNPKATSHFIDKEGVNCGSAPAFTCTNLSPIAPEVAIDSASGAYVVWSTDPRTAQTQNGCNGPTSIGGPSLLPNKVLMLYTPDYGKHWSGPYDIADSTTSGGTTLLWPWVSAGASGNVAVSWYQSDQLTDPDCDSAALEPGGRPTKWTIHTSEIFGVTGASYPPASVNDLISNTDGKHPGGVFHVGGICESGTTCAATGQDRRLGDYFTSALDQNGCLMIASGDTQLVSAITRQQHYTSRPLFIQQSSGASLTTRQACAGSVPPNVAESPVLPALIGAGAVGIGVAALRRRRLRLA